MPGDIRAAFQEAVLAAAGAFSPRGLEYLHHLVRRGARGGQSPAELCRAFRDKAAADFGAMAGHVARRWGLATGADLGRAVFLLAGKKCLSLEAGETLDEYAAAGEFRFE